MFKKIPCVCFIYTQYSEINLPSHFNRHVYQNYMNIFSNNKEQICSIGSLFVSTVSGNSIQNLLQLVWTFTFYIRDLPSELQSSLFWGVFLAKIGQRVQKSGEMQFGFWVGRCKATSKLSDIYDNVLLLLQHGAELCCQNIEYCVRTTVCHTC